MTEQPHLSGPIWTLVHDWPLVHRNDGLWRRWAIAQCTMGSFGVVMVPPSFDNNLGVVRQSLTGLKVQRSHKSMKRRFETTPWERHCVFAYKSVCFLDVFHDWSGSGLEPWLKRISARFGSSLKYQRRCLAELIQFQIKQSGLIPSKLCLSTQSITAKSNVFV